MTLCNKWNENPIATKRYLQSIKGMGSKYITRIESLLY